MCAMAVKERATRADMRVAYVGTKPKTNSDSKNVANETYSLHNEICNTCNQSSLSGAAAASKRAHPVEKLIEKRTKTQQMVHPGNVFCKQQ